jgi:protein-S-isoprenylcysteine O-methyltransferase Ste14
MCATTPKYFGKKRTFLLAAVFYLLIALEFLYMASPFALYFYSVYGPGLRFVNEHPTLAWLASVFLPHIVAESSSTLLDLRNVIGGVLGVFGFLGFCLAAGQVYYHKLARKGVATGGIYNIIRHPQYASLAICGFGLLLLWPRYIVLLSFITMLFVYYFLAKIEERECVEQFGQSYAEYKARTNMFLPFRLPITELPSLPKAGVQRYLLILAVYVVTCIAAIALANGLRSWSVNNLYTLYTEKVVYLSVAKTDPNTLKKIIDIALSNPDVSGRLKSEKESNDWKFINYIMPAEWYVSEIPMNPIEGSRGGHFHPAGYNRALYRIIFTRAELRAGQVAEGKDILLRTKRRWPVVEVTVDLSRERVNSITTPPTMTKYENIPVPVF